MGLEIEVTEFVTFIKFDSKSGRWYTRDDNAKEVEVTNPTAIIDLEFIRLGQIRFKEGLAPDAVWDEPGRKADQPSPDHKRGLSVRLYSPQNIGGLRELMTCAKGTMLSIKRLYDNEFEHAPERQQGLVPLVQCERVEAKKSKHGTNYEPLLHVVKWLPRPEALSCPVTASSAPRAMPAQTSPPDLPDDDLPF